MADTLKDLFERQKVLRDEQARVRDFLYQNNGGLKPEPERLASRKVYLEWYTYENKYAYMPDNERTQAVEAKRRRLMLAEEEANEAYQVACLGGDAGEAYQRVLDEIKQIDADIIKIVSRR
jgi:hypothetical protein